jgi:pyruvate/2-oxoglutarate/acetoin dehydrogenase E1 component
MTYIQHINALIRANLASAQDVVLFGHNIVAGSSLSGLTRGLDTVAGVRVLQTQNSENTLVGVGFGLMLRGVSSIHFMKQQDFLLLGMDHLVNTYNVLRRTANGASCTILPIVVDHGYEGPQSSLNNLDDFCSMAHIPGYLMSNSHDAEKILNTHLVAPGFRILCVSQRLFPTAILHGPAPVDCTPTGELFRYAQGQDATVVACNFAFPQALALWNHLQQCGIQASLFSVNAPLSAEWSWIQEDLQKTRKLVLLDDSKSAHRLSDRLLLAMQSTGNLERLVLHRRTFSPEWLRPNPDLLEVDLMDTVERLR